MFLDIWISEPASMEERCQWLLQQLGLVGNPALTRHKCLAANDVNGGRGFRKGRSGDLCPMTTSALALVPPPPPPLLPPSSLSNLDPMAQWIPVLDEISSSYSGNICSTICGRSICPSPASCLSSRELGQRQLGILRFLMTIAGAKAAGEKAMTGMMMTQGT